MAEASARRLPVVAGLPYIERIRRLPPAFTATLKAEPNNRFHHRAVAVIVGGEKVGYLPPELSHHYFASASDAGPITCPGRRAPVSALEDTGVVLVLDMSKSPPPPTTD